MVKLRAKEVWAVLLLCFGCLLYLYLRTPGITSEHPDYRLAWDHHHYIAMASEPLFEYYISPYSWRILNPLLAKFLPFSIELNFRLINFIALWGTSLFMFLILTRLGFSKILSLFGSLLFISIGWAVSHNFYNFWLTDSLAFLFITAGLWAILAKKDLLFLIILFAGVAAKESVIFIAPLYYTLNVKRIFDRSLLIKTVLLTLPALSVLIALRILLPSLNGNEAYVSSLPLLQREAHLYTFDYIIQNIALKRLHDFSFSEFIIYTTGTFGITLIFLPLLFIRRNFKTFLQFLPLIFMSGLSLAFAVNTERLLVTAFPVFIIMAAGSIKELAGRIKFAELYVLLLPLALIYLHGIKNAFVLSYLLESAVLFGFLSFLIFVSQSKTAFNSLVNSLSQKVQ